MNKKGLVADVSARTGVPPVVVAEVVDAVFSTIARSVVAGEKVVLAGFGTFLRQSRARRTGRDINAGKPVTVPATNVPAFRAGKPFREAVRRRRRRAPAKAR